MICITVITVKFNPTKFKLFVILPCSTYCLHLFHTVCNHCC